jgi:flagellar hook protein FlgE
MSLFDAMSTGLSGMNAGAALVGNAGISLGNMFLQNLQATRANVLHGQGSGSEPESHGSSTQGAPAGIEGAIGQALCEMDPASALTKMMMGKETYDANAQVVSATNQMVGTLLDAVNKS